MNSEQIHRKYFSKPKKKPAHDQKRVERVARIAKAHELKQEIVRLRNE